MAYDDPTDPGGRGDGVRVEVFRIRPWQLWLAGTIALALGIGLALLATSILLVVVPLALVAGLVWRIFAKPVVTTRDGVIEVDYRRVGSDRLPGRDDR
jgi:hypothetical protein